MKRRAHRTPLSIWIIAAIWSLGALAPALRWTMNAWSTGGGAVVALLVVTLVFVIYHAVALVRLSRWPIVLQVATIAWSVIGRALTGNFDVGSTSVLGLLLMWAPFGVYLACTLPHWRKMSWALFGRPYRPAEDRVEVFT
ncbi:hypothetical protein [Caulobacter sp. BK020]|uniref:hypothetical protein n=1 Tax=Caulobacter sp. BK020 TaxID=2512117 RepID=UPI00104E0A98|nr:hypothetical protein [Caulobacter sp. BK020]TCS18446.1 hypothetical protein EV278_101431 [Caulobacter sp. BK020]